MGLPDERRLPALLMGVPIDDLTMDEAVELIGRFVSTGRRIGRTHQVATVNVDFVVNALADESVKRLLQQADVCLADGAPVVWGARAAGMPIRERIAGADLVPALVARSAANGWRIHLFGSGPGTAERAAELLRDRYPGALVSGDSGPLLTDVTTIDDRVLESLRVADADIYCIALGNPKQERFIAAYRRHIDAPVMIGIGGTLDFIVGGRRRAPVWAQRAGLEWVFRAVQEPGRLGRRYAHDARVFFPKLRTYLRSIHPYRAGGANAIYAIADSEVRVTCRIGGPSVGWHAAIEAAALRGSPVTVHADCAVLSLTTLRELVALGRAYGELRIVAPQASCRQQIHSLGLATYLVPAEAQCGLAQG
jgi:N-acetylglucosaminyldiphosphoundecaprenol N-acetyl-beta-D-mannosaminyltransferase